MEEAERIDALIARENLPDDFRATVDAVLKPLADRTCIEHTRLSRPIVVGLCGSQGSGKSTFTAFLAALLETRGRTTAVLSLDDLYLTAAERQTLARTRHRLLATRGPPGTHDVNLGLQTLDALTGGEKVRVALPRFDKAKDTRSDRAEWPEVQAPIDVVLFEGWCVGARPEPDTALAAPQNRLEREEDPDGAWRRLVNQALAGEYQTLFARLDLLVLLEAPSFDCVQAWRGLQERKLAVRLASEGQTCATMDEADLARFVMHYERLTRWILNEMPSRADIRIRLGCDRQILGASRLEVESLSGRR